ncbi:isochorismate synthase [Aequorivita lipolytica]|uniref:isochorismate synthase n=1 Tax=Aequorivita lipolytica TaxID=153267 RepID=A0A5C6YQL5_9FLAO|nr:isochorismate synthase [Aequorivita lipolytica]TXD69657.1 isochorismate synthase [Aequorivita lipolytica]SRX51150.1 Isochorismate synthase EntC [Aequorivita lipolytica]
MDFHLLIKKISKQLKDELPLVVYSFPQQNTVTALLQKTNELFDISEFNANGFVFAPFDYKNSTCFIPESNSEKLQSELIESEINLASVKVNEDNSEEKIHLQLVQKAIENIKRRNANKIVISRPKDFPLRNFSFELLLTRLFSAYPTAFRYIWYHPQTGLWCGATPETLVQVENDSFKTMALAGTQPFTNRKPVIWGPKELDEQQLVTDAITNSLQRVTSVLKVSNPHTHRAGSMYHLRTDITGILKRGKATLTKIAAALHPTPAVCGTPPKFAKEFILQNEGYNREFYTGFFGPIQENGATAMLLVNLRCMKIENNTARIFVGGGITIGSQAKEEWEETQNKMQTMLQVLAPML